jgi:hypothetical protein
MRGPASRALPVVAIAAVASLLAGTLVTARQDGVRVVISAPGDFTQQSMPKGTGVLSGQVRDAASNAPVADAIVTLTLGIRPARALTDAQGRFAFPELPKGSFYVTAARAGFSEGAYGRLRPGGPALFIELRDDERLTDLVIHVWPHAVISGTVVDDFGEPVIGATVWSYRRALVGGKSRFTAGPSDPTDDRGIFRIAGLDAGEYVVGLPMTSHAWPATLENHMLLGGEWPDDLERSSAGQIMSLIGSGVPLGSAGSVVAQVSDRVMPSAVTGEGRLTRYLPQFFAGAAAVADATPIRLAPGEARAGVDLALHTERSWNVTGTIAGLDSAVDDLVLRLSPAGSPAVDTAVAVTDFRGRFTFVGVPSGTYVIRAVRRPRGEPMAGAPVLTTAVIPPGVNRPIPEPAVPAAPLFWAEQAVVVDAGDADAGSIVLRTGARLRGRIAFDGTTPAPARELFERIRITLNAADDRTDGLVPTPIRGRGERNAQFSTVGAPAGRYVVGVSGVPDGWSLGSVMLGGRDISIEPFTLGGTDISGAAIHLTDRPSSVSGNVSLPAGGPDTQAAVVIFPVEPAARVDRGPSPRQLRSVRADRDGAFVLGDLPPGQYLVAAISEALAADWQQSSHLDVLARLATRVDIAAGESKYTTLQTVKVDVR